MTLNGEIALILRHFIELGSFRVTDDRETDRRQTDGQ